MNNSVKGETCPCNMPFSSPACGLEHATQRDVTVGKASGLPQMDWQQVVLNGGPPCFAVNTPHDIPNRYCGRAERWQGHGSIHDYVSLTQFAAAQQAIGYQKGIEESAKIAESDDHRHSSGYRCERGEFIAKAIRSRISQKSEG